NLPAGSYPVKAVVTLENIIDNTIREVSLLDTLIVDRVLPDVQITYPAESLMLCPIPQGNWYGIPVEGTALDNIEIKQYELYYGIGDNPDAWLPAMTRNQKGERVKIKGSGTIKGRIGVWDVTDFKGSTYSLKLKVIDKVGNVSCYTTSFSMDAMVEITKLTRDKALFSPNGDDILDDVSISYEIDEYATVNVNVFKLIQKAEGSYVLDSTPVRTIISGQQYLGGTENSSWDGKDNSGMVVPDGKYGIAVSATDSCMNMRQRWIDVEVDNTPPMTTITYPRPPDILGNIVEVKGTADDLHFQSYTLEAGPGDNSDLWLLISSNTTPIKENVLGKWNTFGLDGRWTLRLTAVDTVGNKNETTTAVDLGLRKDLIKDLDITPKLFSPNNDGKLDTTNIKYELTDACNVSIEILDFTGETKKSYAGVVPSAGAYTYAWNGRDNADVIVPDGEYKVKLTAALSSNPSVTQDETVTVVIDTTPPLVDIAQPEENSYIRTDVAVSGAISDENILEYTVSYTGDAGTELVETAKQSREDYTFGIINEPPEGSYTLQIKAQDFGENVTEENIPFTIDRTPPKVALDTPKDGEYYGFGKETVEITGAIEEKNLETYSLRYGIGSNPAEWTELLAGDAVPSEPQLFSWNVNKDAGVPDGFYTLSLYAKDKVELEGEVKVRITIDNTPPEVLIILPQEGDYVKEPLDIKGTAFDNNLDKYTLEFSEGSCSDAFKWAVIKTAAASVNAGLLTAWQALPPDGDYCLRLIAIDKLENKAETKVNVKVDTHPPAAPVLSGETENKTDARLNWTQNTEPDLSGYNIYRDNQKVNTDLLPENGYLDQSLDDGIYAYTVKAVD
ncbi:MAG: hypothetical protein HY753_09410, partial [Nitrospirae bacterium]|nr:hypothetical protein [Nitrospirota bacterium]